MVLIETIPEFSSTSSIHLTRTMSRIAHREGQLSKPKSEWTLSDLLEFDSILSSESYDKGIKEIDMDEIEHCERTLYRRELELGILIETFKQKSEEVEELLRRRGELELSERSASQK